jgi:predicted Zn-dependent protease
LVIRRPPGILGGVYREVNAMSRKRLTLAAILLLLLLAAPGCITDPVTGNKKFGFDMSEEAEIADGRKFAPSFKSQYEGAYPDRALQDYCNRIVLGMAKTSHRPGLPWNFTILNSSEVNAFALPGGTVCITRGLLYRMETEAMFAGVMGHEIGHVTHRHYVQGQSRQTIYNVLLVGASVAAVATDWDYAPAALAAGGLVGQLVLLKYSRDQESESDESGVDYSRKAGYDPRQLANVFEVFEQLKEGRESPPAWLSTHPVDADRVEHVNELVAKRYPRVVKTDGAGLIRNTPQWERLIAKLNSDQKVYEDYDKAAGRFPDAAKAKDRQGMRNILRQLEDCERRLPGHALFVSGQGVVLYEMGEKTDARDRFERANRMQEDLFEPHMYLALLADERKDDATAYRHGRRAAELYGFHPLGWYYAGRASDRMKKYGVAVENYEMVLQTAPKDSEPYQYSARRLSEIR